MADLPPPQFERVNENAGGWDRCRSRCRSIYIDLQTRTCCCKECKRVIDPFDYLWGWSQGEYFVLTSIERYEQERDRLSKEVAALKKERNNLKAQIKRTMLSLGVTGE